MCGNGGAVFQAEGPSMCKDKEGNNVSREREGSGLLRCRGLEMAGLSLEGWIWAPSWSTSDACLEKIISCT